MKKLLIIADDLTGALDTGVKFCGRGLKVEVLCGSCIDFKQFNADVLVINSDTRHLDYKQAYKVVFDITKNALEFGFDFIYKKTDSALRGNLGAELSAVMDAAKTGVCFVPAYPAMKRITKQGIHYIDGIPVAQSVFGSDPFNPVKSSVITKILEEQTDKKILVHASGCQYDVNAINVYDASTDEDVMNIVSTLIDKTMVVAGCAGCALAIAELFNKKTIQEQVMLSGPLLVSCGSINPVTVKQIDYICNKGMSVEKLSPCEKLDSNYLGSKEYENKINYLSELLRTKKFVCIDTNDKDCENATEEYAKERGYDLDNRRELIASNLAQITTGVVEKTDELTLMCIGGDTLLSVLRAMDVKRLEPITELYTGVVFCSFEYRNKKYNLITKSGGFGEETLYEDIAKKLNII